MHMHISKALRGGMSHASFFAEYTSTQLLHTHEFAHIFTHKFTHQSVLWPIHYSINPYSALLQLAHALKATVKSGGSPH
eukprot:187992-Chlamydomonas_euryale.AAC.2